MSEFTGGFWDLYIALVTLLSIVACGVLLKSQSVRRPRGVETTGHQWDEDLAEYDNPLPRWWSWLFYLTIAFSLAYLVLYPGLGSWRGTLGWSQVGQLQAEQQAAQKEFGPLYQQNCIACHGVEGKGNAALGAPNLADRIWLHGSAEETVMETIAKGRNNQMPAHKALLDEARIHLLTAYVLSLSK